MTSTSLSPNVAFARCSDRDARFARIAASSLGTFARDAGRKARRTAARRLTRLATEATAAARSAGYGDELADARMWAALTLVRDACRDVGNLHARDRFVQESFAALTRAHAAASAADARIDALAEVKP